jgi:DHA1 family multidrug resistance protein-like MFS transporter
MRGLNRNLLLLFAASLAAVVSIQLVQPLFPLFLDSCGASEMEISLVISLSSLSTMALMIPVGFLMERVGKKRMLLIGLVIWAVTPVFMGSVGDWRVVAPLYMVYNLAEVFVGPARMAMIAEYASPESQATTFSIMSMDWPLGGIVSPPLSGFLAERSGWRLPFLVAALVMALASVPVLMLGGGEGGGAEEKVRALDVFRREYLSAVSLFFVFSLAFSAGQSVVGTMLPIFLKNQVGLPPSSIGLFFTGSSVLSLLGLIPGGWLADRYGRKRVIVAFLLPIPLIFGAWATVDDWGAMLVLYSLFAGCLSMMGSASFALVSDSFPQELRGAAFSVRMTGFRMGAVVGPLLGGYLYSTVSPVSPFTAAGLLFLIGIPVVYLIKEKPIRPRAH